MTKKCMSILDFGSEKLTIMAGMRDVNNSIYVTSIAEENYEGFCDGQFISPENLESSIKNCISKFEKNCGFVLKELTVGVPTEFCYSTCKTVSQSFLKPKKFDRRDIENLFSSVDDLNVSTHQVINKGSVYFVIGENNKVNSPIGQVDKKVTACLSFVLAQKDFVENIRNILSRCGIHNVNFVSSAYAEALYLFDDDERENYVLLIDCGYITTSVMLLRGRGILNLSSFSLGGGHISADLSKCLKLPFSSAEVLAKKIVLSINPSDKDMYEILVDNKVIPISMKVANAIVESRLEVIASGIQKCFSLWQYDYPSFIPIYLTGGGLSFIKGAKDMLGKELGKNVEIARVPYSIYNKPNYSSSMSLLNYVLNNSKNSF